MGWEEVGTARQGADTLLPHVAWLFEAQEVGLLNGDSGLQV